MQFLSEVSERVLGLFRPISEMVRRRLFGPNNERIDFVMDSFYKLAPKQQLYVLWGLGSLLAVFVIGLFTVYTVRINDLDDQLNKGFAGLWELRAKASDYQREMARLEWLKSNVGKKTRGFRPKPFFEKQANNIGVELESLRSQELNIPEENPLGKNFREIRVKFRMPKVSLKRMLHFLSEIEKSEHALTVRELKIRNRFGSKRLYFDTEADVAGYKPL